MAKIPKKGSEKSQKAVRDNKTRSREAANTPLKAIREAQKDMSPKDKLSERQVRKKKS